MDNNFKQRAVFFAVSAIILSIWVVLSIKFQPILSIWHDEAISIVAMDSYSRTSILDLSTVLPSGEKYQCYIYCHANNFIQSLFNLENPRIASLLFAFIGLLAVFWFTLKLTSSPSISLLVTSSLGFTPVYLSWASSIRHYSLFLALFWLTLVTSYSLSTKHGLFANTLRVLLVIFLFLVSLTVHKLAILLPVAIVALIMLRRPIKLTLSHVLILTSFLAVLFFLLKPTTITLTFTFPYYAVFVMSTYGLLVLPALISSIFFEKYKAEINFLLGIYLLYLVPLSVFTDIVHPRYLFHLSPALVIAGLLGLVNIFNYFKSKSSLYLAYVFAFIYAALLIISGQVTLNPASITPYETVDFKSIYLHTPQAPWSDGYKYIQSNLNEETLVITSFPIYSRLYRQQTDIWLAHDLLYRDLDLDHKTMSDPYTGSKAVWSNDQLQSTTSNRHGYIIFDSMATDHMAEERLDFINNHYKLVFTKENSSTNDNIYVYSF